MQRESRASIYKVQGQKTSMEKLPFNMILNLMGLYVLSSVRCCVFQPAFGAFFIRNLFQSTRLYIKGNFHSKKLLSNKKDRNQTKNAEKR